MVKLDRIFLQGWVNGILKVIGDVQDRNNEALFICKCYDNTKGEDAIPGAYDTVESNP